MNISKVSLGVVAKQYVYGVGVDELVVMDRPVVEAATLSAPCPVFLDAEGEEDAEAQVEACLAPDVDTDSGEEGASGECGFTSYGFNATEPSVSESTVVCVSGAWMLVGADAVGSSPVSGCMTCDAGTSFAGAANVSIAPGASCSPCGPNLGGTLIFDNATEWGIQAVAGQGCNPCPAPAFFEAAFAGNSTNPTEPSLTNSTVSLRDCVAVNLDARLYFLQDEQRTVYALADKDGVVKEGYEYDPYGTVTVLQPATLLGSVTFTMTDTITGASSASSPYLFTGRRYDAETGLLYFRTRYLDSEMGRFISEDTIGVWGDPNSLGNAYSYCANNPTTCTDPMGERRCKWHFWKKHCLKAAVEVVEEAVEDVADAAQEAVVQVGKTALRVKDLGSSALRWSGEMARRGWQFVEEIGRCIASMDKDDWTDVVVDAGTGALAGAVVSSAGGATAVGGAVTGAIWSAGLSIAGTITDCMANQSASSCQGPTVGDGLDGLQWAGQSAKVFRKAPGAWKAVGLWATTAELWMGEAADCVTDEVYT